MAGKDDDSSLSGIGDILRGFGKIFNSVVDMAEKDISKKSVSGELFKSNNEHGLKGRYDFSVKMGLNDKDVKGLQREPDIITPQMDIFKDKDRIIAVLEMPEITIDKINFRLDGGKLLIEGKGNKAVYSKTIDLEGLETTEENISISENNGIFKIVINKA